MNHPVKSLDTIMRHFRIVIATLALVLVPAVGYAQALSQ